MSRIRFHEDDDNFLNYCKKDYKSIMGPTGPRGERGVTGPTGPRGEQGLRGPTGLQGEQGISGATGPQGAQGLRGPTGPQGIQGERGVTGPQGIQGERGVTGPQGIQGERGVTGPQGIQGERGVTGPQGTQGERGATGPQGIQGERGVTGPQGIQGERGVTGPQGTQGEQGVTGPQGNQGERGVTGPQGIQGERGITGPTGPGAKYFFTESQTPIAVPLSNFQAILSLAVTTTQPGEIVRIDSMIETIINTITTSGNQTYSYNIIFRLIRDTSTNLLTEVQLAERNMAKPSGTQTIIDFPNITWTDTPPGPGTYFYHIVASRGTVDLNIDTVTLGDRQMDAIVFPPTNN